VLEVPSLQIRNFWLSAVFAYHVSPVSANGFDGKKIIPCFFAAFAVELHDLLIASQKLHPRYLPAHLFS